MTREDVENKIYEKMLEIKEIYNDYYPDGKYLSLCLHNSGSISFNNDHWECDVKKTIDFCSDEEAENEQM